MTARDTGRCQLPWVVLLSLIPQLTAAQTTPKLEPGIVRAALVPRVNDGTLRGISLRDPAFHRSALPDASLPPLMSPTERIRRAHEGTTLRFGIGSRYAFSQVGIEVLALVLARHLYMPLSGALHSPIRSPLAMRGITPATGTRMSQDAALAARWYRSDTPGNGVALAPGWHDPLLRPATPSMGLRPVRLLS